MITYSKTCCRKSCKNPKNGSLTSDDYYQHRYNSGNIDRRCIFCKRQDSKEAYQRKTAGKPKLGRRPRMEGSDASVAAENHGAWCFLTADKYIREGLSYDKQSASQG